MTAKKIENSLKEIGLSDIVVVEDDGVIILSGTTSSYFGKQMAQEIVRRYKNCPVKNEILVHKREIGRYNLIV